MQLAEDARATLAELREPVNAGDFSAAEAVVQALADLGSVGSAWLESSWKPLRVEGLVDAGYRRDVAERLCRRAALRLAFAIPLDQAEALAREVSDRLDREDEARRRAASK